MKKLPPRTKWFTDAKPKRRGVYELMSGTGHRVGYQVWHGDKWGPWFETAEDAARLTGPHDYAASGFQNDQWRGLTKPV